MKQSTVKMTKHETEIIARLRSGIHASKVAETVGVSEGAVRYTADKFGVKCPKKAQRIRTLAKNNRWINLEARNDASGYF